MTTLLQYKGYLGSVEVDVDEGFAYGRLMFIKDVVSYRSDAIKGIRAAFQAAVDDYLATCAELGDAPDTPCKGTFNVRLGPDLHHAAAISSARVGVSLNEWVKQACEMRLAAENVSKEVVKKGMGEATVLAASFEEEQVFEVGGQEWHVQNNHRPFH